MANDNGIFSDLFNAVGAPIQNLADAIGSGFNAATEIAQTLVSTVATIVTSTANAAIQLIQGVASAVTSAITPKQ